MEANFVLSQKGTNLLKDDKNELYNKYRESKDKTLVTFLVNTHPFNIASLFIDEN